MAIDLPSGWQIPVTLITSIGDTIMNRFNVHVDVISDLFYNHIGHRDK